MTDRRISGVACADGEGAAGAEILALDGDRVAAHTEAGADGGFEFDVADIPGLRLIARCRLPAAGLAVAPSPADGAALVMRLEDVAPVAPVTFTTAERGAHPPILRLVPVALGSLAESDVQWSLRRVGDRADSAYLALALESGSLTCRLQHGRWWFTADLVVTADTRALDGGDDVRLQAVDAQRRDGRPLEAMFDGWVVDVDGPAEVALWLAPAAAQR